MTAAARPGERGFTVVEVLIALLVLVIGMAGILSLQLTSTQATAFSRHATEATVLAEDKMEDLRTQPAAALVSDDDQVNARGELDLEGLYIRVWVIAPGPPIGMTVTVSWLEQGDTTATQERETYKVELVSARAQ